VGTTAIANGGFPGSATLTITDSTVSNHRSMPNGGGIANFGGSVTLVRSTIANNESGNSSGGGIENHAMLTVIESTISGNQSDEVGGGIFNQGTTTLSATILAGNTNTNDGSPDNCGGTITSNGYNLFGSPCGPLAPTDIVGTVGQPLDPMLKPLGGYGGTTNTMAPQPTSPAVNAISIGAAGGLCPSSGTTDQRGISRPQSGACDIGSVER
jgi:hypothetical protein